MKQSIIPAEQIAAAIDDRSWLQSLGRRLFLEKLAGLREGRLTVVDGTERRVFGDPDPRCALQATVEILHPQTYADAAFGGTVGAGEAYIRGF
jgi:cyclopropane-fatty-acyl-phospholipid synthase